jgi:hypothetical protein
MPYVDKGGFMRIAALLLCVVCSNAVAITGNELHSLLSSSKADENIEAYRYLQGVIDAEELHMMYEEIISEIEKRAFDNRRFFCMPKGSTLGQAKDIVLVSLRENPKDRHIKASQLAQVALRSVWPCKK